MKSNFVRLILVGIFLFSFLSPTHAEKLLLVGGQPDAAQGDDADVLDHLEALGHEVTYQTGDESEPGDADDYDAIIISSTLGSGSVRGKFQDAEKPIMQWEEALVRWEHGDPDGNFRMSELSRNGQGRETDKIQIAESAVGHPLTAGLPAGEHEIFEDFNRTPQQFGQLAPGLIRIAELDPEFAEEGVSFWTDADGNDQEGPEFVLTAIDKGGELGPEGEGFFAPEKRVNFPIEDVGFSILNENGIALFNCSLEWLLGRNCLGPDAEPGDFDADGDFDVDDINALTTESAAGTNNADFDLNGDGAVNDADVTVWAKDIANTWIGDANVDGEFNSGDFVQVFSAGKFESPVDANWADGDWNGDGRFNSGDFVAAFSDGGFELGPRPAASAVPEPGSIALLLIGMVSLARFRRR